MGILWGYSPFMTIQEYIDKVNSRYRAGNTTEHSFRGDLQNLLEAIITDAQVTNEPKRIECGAPDYIISKKEIPVGYIEAKDLADDLSLKKHKDQFERYKGALSNLIITNYLDFQVYKEGDLVATYSIGKISDGSVVGLPDQYQAYTDLIKDFSSYVGQTIKSPSKLAKMMAGKAKMLATVIDSALTSDEETAANSTLQEQLNAFKDILIHDITPKGFADIYAQTIAYGMFAARLHDYELHTFSRIEAAQKIPKTNPFLRKLFGYIAGIDLDDRLVWIVDALADIFRATDVRALLKNFGKATRQQDPIIHFYETFLSEYDPKLRKSRGVWYTPEPVVNFIVRAVDDILHDEFGLKGGLANTDKIEVEVATQGVDKRKKDNKKTVKQKVHKVQILDPATGTGTFLAEVIRQIHSKFKGQQGIWNKYVENDLIPRINGFELLMASYAMAHLKLDMLLTETGYKNTNDQRLRVYLTNSLEEHHPDTGTLFANWLSTEANEANQIKRDTPVMVVLGNPPYSISSSNKGTWIESLLEIYKDDLQEQNLNALSDDYVKFIRYAQYFIDKNNVGVIAMITNNSYIDGLTQRNMRKSLLNTFDKLYFYDLHGSYYRKETAPDGSKDENVFDIMQGVSICFMIKNNSTTKKVFHYDSFGLRNEKYELLAKQKMSKIEWNEIYPEAPSFYFVPKKNENESEYKQFISIDKLFPCSGNGIKFRKDNLLVKSLYTKDHVLEMLHDISFLQPAEVYTKYNFKATSDWDLESKKGLFVDGDSDNITKINYRQFDYRYSYYPLNTINEIIVRGDSRRKLMSNYIHRENFGLITGRQGQVVGSMPWNLAFICNAPTDMNIFYRGGGINYPLYLYPEGDEIFDIGERQPNLDEKIVAEIAESLQLRFTSEKEDTKDTFAPIDILDYIYAVLHSPTYRETYKEFLKIDFPRVPYPKDKKKFWQLVKLGGELRQIHLLESDKVEEYITEYPKGGDNIVGKSKMPKYEDGKVYINEEQYFDKVPEVAWEFYIGGYQPAQKWLKDRKGRELSIDDIMHYQKIIVALAETDRIMKEIEEINIVENS